MSAVLYERLGFRVTWSLMSVDVLSRSHRRRLPAASTAESASPGSRQPAASTTVPAAAASASSASTARPAADAGRAPHATCWPSVSPPSCRAWPAATSSPVTSSTSVTTATSIAGSTSVAAAAPQSAASVAARRAKRTVVGAQLAAACAGAAGWREPATCSADTAVFQQYPGSGAHAQSAG